VGFREGVRWKEVFVYCTGTELLGSNMAAQRNFNCLSVCGVQRGRSVEGGVCVLYWH
jgi:hypothetical protein